MPKWETRWVEVRGADGVNPPRLLVYPHMTVIEPMLTLDLEGASVTRSRIAPDVHAWELCSKNATPAAPVVFAAEDDADAERWVGACRQQALVSADQLDLTPRIVKVCASACGLLARLLLASRGTPAAATSHGSPPRLSRLPAPRISPPAGAGATPDLTPTNPDPTPNPNSNPHPHPHPHPTLPLPLPQELEVNGFLEPAQRGLIVNPSELSLVRHIANGFHGAVYEGEWRGARVALKFCTNDAAAELVAECALHQKLDHPNVIKVHGICLGLPPDGWPDGLRPPCMCVELADGGTFLKKLKALPRERLLEADYWIEACLILEGAAHGLAYLHSERIMHRDLKADNFLLEGGQVKIADFGLSRGHKRGEAVRQQDQVGTFSHHAPEVLKGDYDLSADIFSFGIVICEALTAREAQDIIDETRTPSFGLHEAGLKSYLDATKHPASCFELADLAVACCDLEPQSRPTVTDLLSRLESILADLTTYINTYTA